MQLRRMDARGAERRRKAIPGERIMHAEAAHALVRLSATAILAGYAGAVGSAGFALTEQSASGLGNAFAGEAAVAQDASTVFSNPAGMSFLPGPQVLQDPRRSLGQADGSGH